MRSLLLSKHKSKGSQQSIEHEVKSPLPILELSFNDNCRIMPDLSRRFTLLRNNAGGFLPIGTVQQHLEYQRERGQLTRSEENLILQELDKHTTIYEEEPTESHTSVSKSIVHLPAIASPIKTSSACPPFFGSSSERDTAYIQKESKISSSSKVQSIGGTRRPKEPIISEEPGLSDHPSTEPPSVTQRPEEQSTECPSEDDEKELVLTPVRLQRISMALDRILGDHVVSPTSALEMRPASSSTRDNIGSGSVSGRSNQSSQNLTHSSSMSVDKNAPDSKSAESRVHDELLKALSATPTTASASPSLVTTDSSLRCSDEFRPEPLSSMNSDRVYSCTSSHERQFSESSFTSNRSSTAISSCFHGSHDEHEHDTGIPTNFALPRETINGDKLFPDSNIRYSDLIAIQETLVASAPASSLNVSSRIPCATAPSLSPKNSLGRSMSHSTTSHSSSRIRSQSINIARPARSSSFRKQVSTTKLSRGIGSCHRMRSTSQSVESSSPTSDPFIRISSVSPSSSLRHRSNGVPLLMSSSPSSAVTPESQSFPLTPVQSQQLDPNPRHQNLLVQNSTSSNDVDKHLGIHQVSSLPDVKEEAQPFVSDLSLPSTDDVEVPMRLDAEATVPTVIWPRRAQPGRANRPVPTTLLFRDVEAQAVAANAALRHAATLPREVQASDGAVTRESGPKLKKDIKKKKSISRARIGAPQLVSASANLASLELDQAALVLRANAQASSVDTDDHKRGSTKSSFKLRLRKKKPTEGVTTQLDEPSGLAAMKGQVGPDWGSTPSEHIPNAPATVTPATIPTLPSNSASPQQPGSRDTDEINGVERSTKTQSNSLGPSDGTLKQSLRRLLSTRPQSKPATASQPIIPRVPSLQGAAVCPWEPIHEGVTAEAKEDIQDLKRSHLSTDWVDVPPSTIEAVAPLKIMKVPGSIKDNNKGGKLRARRTTDHLESAPGAHPKVENTLKPPKLLGGDVAGEKRPSTDSVQRLLDDLGFPMQQGADAGEVKQKSEPVPKTNQDGEEKWVYHSAEAKGKGRAIADDEATMGNSCSAGYDPHDPIHKQSVVADDTSAYDTLPPDAVPYDTPTHLSSHVFSPTLPEAFDGVNVSDPNNLMLSVPDQDDTRSDYAASIFDLYDRPESSIWEQPCATEANPSSHSETTNQRGCATPTKSREVEHSFLDITGSPSDQWHHRRSAASSSGSSEVNPAPGEKTDDVMKIMNKFRKDVTSHRVSTASGLFPPTLGPYRSRKPSNVNGVHDGGCRKTVMEDEEDEQRAWKLILGGE